MTTPHQHNCPHQDEGWCLTCVGNLERKIQRLRERFDLILNLTRIALHRPLGPDELRQFAELEHYHIATEPHAMRHLTDAERSDLDQYYRSKYDDPDADMGRMEHDDKGDN